MAFEAVCFKHIPQICKALHIERLVMGASSWRAKATGEKPGAQIDLLLERHDGAINIVEIKNYAEPFVIDKGYSVKLENKVERFREVVGNKKELFLTFVTTNGVKLNMYSRELVDA